MTLLQKFAFFIKKENLFQQKDKLLIAVSGGADSSVLCALCDEAGFDFAIAHCNFKLRGEESERDELFVKKMSEQYKVKLFSTSFNTSVIAKAHRKSIEETARNLRYDWFNQIIETGKQEQIPFKYLLTAHHADDNIETVVMNFFRGTGIKGLRGILPKQNKIVRPLLFANRKDILEYAAANKIDFVTDSTNAANDYTRNLFRNEILPAIEKAYPQAANNVLRNIDRFIDVDYLYEQSIEVLKKQLIEKRGNEIHIPVLKLAKSKPVNTVIYEIIKEYNFTAAQVGEVEKLLQSESGKYIKSASHRILRNRNWLIISPIIATAETVNIVIEKNESNILFENGTLKIEQVELPEILSASAVTIFINSDEIKFPLLLRKWKTGDYFYPFGMKNPSSGKVGKKKLSRFFTDLKLSLLQKENCWVLESDKKIVWVVGHRIDERFKITSNSKYILKLSLTHSLQKS